MRKGIVNFLEFVFVAVVLFVAFTILFPRFSYTSRWDEAGLIINGRDILLTSDRTGNLHDHAFNFNNFTNLTETLAPKSRSNLLFWTETDNTVKNATVIACNCSQQVIDDLNSWFNGLRINGREVRVLVIATKLDDINNPDQISDVLFIHGYKPLSNYNTQILEFMSHQKGVVEMMDFTTASEVDNDVVQKSIFGLRWEANPPNSRIDYNEFRKKPDNSSDILYHPYKLFHNIPVPIFVGTNTTGTIPVDGGVSTCNNSGENTIKLGNVTFNFWLCEYGTVYVDRDRNGAADTIVYQGDSFTLNNLGANMNLSLAYVQGLRKIGISFDWQYRMEDIIRTKKDVPADPGGLAWGFYYTSTVYTVDNKKDKILVEANQVFHGQTNRMPVVILNSTGISNVAYIADFVNDRDVVGDDHRLLLMSLLLWASNKHSTSSTASNLKTGRLTSYLNLVNVDMFELYRINLGVGRPF